MKYRLDPSAPNGVSPIVTPKQIATSVITGSESETVDTGSIVLPTREIFGVASTTRNMSAATDVVALICPIPQTGNITGIKFATSTVGTGCTIIGTIETVTGSKPSGTLYHANATGTVVVANTDDNVSKSITYTSFAATQGDLVAIKLGVSSGTPTNLGIRTSISQLGTSAFPCLYVNSATADAWGTNTPCILLTYDTGDVVPVGVSFYTSNTNLTVSSSTTPDEVGILFTAPYSCRTNGFVWRELNPSSAVACDMVLYDSSDNVVISKSMSAEALVATGLASNYWGLWGTNANLTKDEQYRLVLKPTTTTSWTLITQSSTGVVLTPIGGNTPVYTSRTNGGAWTNTSGAILPMGLLVDQVVI